MLHSNIDSPEQVDHFFLVYMITRIGVVDSAAPQIYKVSQSQD